MEFQQDMRTRHRYLNLFALSLALLQLVGCLSDEPVDPENPSGFAISFTNPSDTSVIRTPDIVVNITGTTSSQTDIDVVTWQNDRGGKGTANGKESWVTGNIVLQLGSNNITITAKDINGITASKTLTVERENTAPSATNQTNTTAVLMYSYQPDLSNAAPVRNASIRKQIVYFFVDPGTDWSSRGIQSISIRCCKGQEGPGIGEGYATSVDLVRAPWSEAFDLSAFEAGGTRRVKIQATFSNGSVSDSPVFDFIVAQSSGTNTAPMISGLPEFTATAGVQYSFRPSAQDPDGDTMQFSISNKPAWASFSKTTGRLYGTPTANDVRRYSGIVISVSDGQTSSSLPSFSIDVEAIGNGAATLTWSIPTERTDNTPLGNDLNGFNIYYGQTSGDYANKIQVTNSGLSTYMVDNLSSGQWFFVVTAYDSGGLESNASNERSKSF